MTSTVCAFVEPHQGASYDQILRFARRAQECGFDGIFVSDHYLPEGSASGEPGPLDAWLTLSGLARETERLRLGTLMSSATFRPPSLLAIAAAQIDQMSGGRLELGLGAGWYEAEHRAHGIPFPPLRERFERLSEQLEFLRLLWRGRHDGRVSHHGVHYRIDGHPARPQPRQPGGPPIIVGGRGLLRTPALAARFADEFNVPFVSAEAFGAHTERLDRECEAVGRDPAELRRSCVVTVLCGATAAEAEHRRRSARPYAGASRGVEVSGTAVEVSARLREYGALGADRIYLQFLDLDDLEHLELLGTEVLADVRLNTDYNPAHLKRTMTCLS